MVKTPNRKNGVKEKKVKLDLFIKVSRGVFFAVHHFCCILQQFVLVPFYYHVLNERTNCDALA